jgi:outer membrane immunogenic protein
MKNIVIAATAAALSVVAAPAFAQVAPATFYGTLGYSHVESGPLEFGVATARAGARFGQYLGAEVEGGLGVNGDSGVEIDHSLAAYAVGFVPVTPQFDLIARVGYGTTRTDAGAFGKSSDESWNYGAGGQYFFDAANGVRAEYTRHDFTHDLGKADVWSVSYVRKF